MLHMYRGLAHHKFFTTYNIEDDAYVIIDIIVVCLLCIETIIRILSTYPTYCMNIWNIIIDIGILSIIIITLIMYTVQPEDVLYGTLIQVLRSGVQLYRLLLVLKHHKQRSQIILASNNNIDFNQFLNNNNNNNATIQQQQYINVNTYDYATQLPYNDKNSFTHFIQPTYTIDDDNQQHQLTNITIESLEPNDNNTNDCKHNVYHNDRYNDNNNNTTDIVVEPATMTVQDEHDNDNNTEQHKQFLNS